MHELWGKIIALVWLVVAIKNQALFGSFVSGIITCGKLTLTTLWKINQCDNFDHLTMLCNQIIESILIWQFWFDVTRLERAACVSMNLPWPNPVAQIWLTPVHVPNWWYFATGQRWWLYPLSWLWCRWWLLLFFFFLLLLGFFGFGSTSWYKKKRRKKNLDEEKGKNERTKMT